MIRKSVRSSDQSDGARRGSAGRLAFFEEDVAYRDWLARNQAGYVVNVRRTLSPNYVVLHRATCPHISMPREPGAYTERSYRKLCGETAIRDSGPERRYSTSLICEDSAARSW